jgi:hypothetical protein
VYRKPVTADLESHSRTAQRNPIVANLNLLQSLIVYPDPGTIVEQIKDYPVAYGRFVEEAVSPFFGGNVNVKTREL